MLSPSSTESATGRRFTGVDSGGTFTDMVAIDVGSGTIQVAKVPSTPSRPVVAVAESLERLGSRRIARLVHGTTVATNAVLQRSGARLCLLTTEGFEDIAYIQRINRPRAYDLLWQKPDPLVVKRRCYGVRERIGSEGEVLLPLTEETASSVVARMEDLVSAGEIDAIAICLLFSYANDAHEQLLGRRLRRALPDTPVSISSEVSPVWREYERTSTVLTDAYIKPLMSRYFDDLDVETSRFLDGSPLTILKSNGGTGNVSTVAPKPVTTILSGLAGGVVGGAYFAAAEDEPLAITFDMGGTSTDIGLVSDGQVGHINEYEVEWGLPVVTPVVDVHTIGAGGGSIAAVDTGSLLQVGPRSAGARPGPACYGLGGSSATVTDANLVLGRLNPHYFLGGTVKAQPASGIRYARSTWSAAGDLDRRGCHRRGGRCRREHGERHPPGHDRARCRPSGLRAHSVRGRRAPPCLRGSRSGRNPADRGSAQSRSLLRVRRRDRTLAHRSGLEHRQATRRHR